MNQSIQPVQPFIQQLPAHVQQVSQVPPADGDDTISLAKYVGFLIDNRWMIAAVALVATLLGIAYVMIATPIYESNILIQIDESAPPAKSSIMGEISATPESKNGAASEMEVLRSRLVVGRAVDGAQLYLSVQPKYFPVIGAWLARNARSVSEPGLYGRGGYVWGTERAQVAMFNVPEPLEGRRFVLIAEDAGGYRLVNEDLGMEIRGRVGATVASNTDYGIIELRVERLNARTGAQFYLTRYSHAEAVERLQQSLKITEKGKQSNIISIALDSPDPKLARKVLNEIGNAYIGQNEERKAMEAEKSLVFLNRQLPELKQELERSEAEYNAMRNKLGTIDIGEEVKSVLQLSTLNQTKLIELKQKREELRVRFQDEHPMVDSINQQIRALNRELATLEARIKRLPAIEQEVYRLSRDVKVNTEVYTAVLSAAQQMRLATSSKAGNARLLDNAAVPVKPIKPKRAMVVSMAALAGIFLGVGLAFVRKALYGKIDDPHEIKQALGLPVNVTIPYSAGQQQLHSRMQNNTRSVSVLAHDAPADSAIESLRNFRASLQFAMRDARSNIIVITSPTPEVGKSFVSVNFAAVLASVGKKVLLIDGDLRRGHLHRYFGLDRANGLSDAIAGDLNPDNIIHREVVDNVDFLSTGTLPVAPAELLAHPNFSRLLQLISVRYDFVLIDTAPVLAVADALVIAPFAGAIYSIVRGGVTTMGEIEETVRRLNQAGVAVTGTVFNDLRPGSSRYGYGSRYANYQYVEYK